MARSSASKFAANPFLSCTVERFPLMGEILTDTLPRAERATAGIAEFGGIMAELRAADAAWSAGETALAAAEAALPAATMRIDDHMAALRRKPDLETNSLLEAWDARIRAELAFRGSGYIALLPHGRRTLTAGIRAEQFTALDAFATALARRTDKPPLVALGAEVRAFHDKALALHDAQTRAKSQLETARRRQEELRVAAAQALYGLVGQGMAVWRANPARVETLWDVNLLRAGRMKTPAAPPDTAWDAPRRTLSTSTLPAHATRLEAWRCAPGGVPELLARGPRGATALLVPANIIFLPGVSYQLWLCGANSRGRGTPGPAVAWGEAAEA